MYIYIYIYLFCFVVFLFFVVFCFVFDFGSNFVWDTFCFFYLCHLSLDKSTCFRKSFRCFHIRQRSRRQQNRLTNILVKLRFIPQIIPIIYKSTKLRKMSSFLFWIKMINFIILRITHSI